MINHLDNLLRHLLMNEVDGISAASQIRFRPPDDSWRTEVTNTINNLALNVYMTELRENRKLRSNQQVRVGLQNGQVMRQQAPARVDCHYLISAWNPAQPNLEPTIDEHVLLYQVSAALLENAPLNPTRIYPQGSPALTATPKEIRDADLPTQVLPVEGFPKLAEFWGTMGANHRWKPVVYLIVTLPVIRSRYPDGPMVTTLITEYRHWHRPETAEIFIQIGGHVQGAEPVLPVATGSALVTNINGAGTTVTVNDPTPFQAGDAVTEDESARAIVSNIAGNDLILSAPLAGLANGDTLRIANIETGQDRFRLASGAGLQGVSPGDLALLTGEDAANPGVVTSERVTIQTINADAGLVQLGPSPLRTITFNLDVPPAVAPALRPLTPQSDAWVALENQAGTAILQTAETDDDGRFRFENVHEGDFRLRARSVGFSEGIRPIRIPSTTGDYDVVLDLQP